MTTDWRIVVDSPQGRHVLHTTAGGGTLSQLLRREAMPLNTRCGERGLCDGCTVELIGGRLIHTASGMPIEAQERAMAVRGCEYRLGDGGAGGEVHIPARSLLSHEPQIVTSFRLNVVRAHDPLWRQVVVSCEVVDGHTPAADIMRREVAHRLGASDTVEITSHALRQIGDAQPTQQYKITVERCIGRWIITQVITTPTPEFQPIGAAIDIGTTTVAVMLIDMRDGHILAQASGFNRQMHLGDDVLTRINLCSTDAKMVEQLEEAIIQQTIRPLLLEAMKSIVGTSETASSKTRPEQHVTTVVLAGNTTMLHLAAGVNPAPMGVSPFRPVFTDHRTMTAREMRLDIPGGDNPTIHLLPCAAAYIGADLTAGVLASGLLYDNGPSILIDVGTNGEIILKHGDRLLGCATAAGPAFEGGKLASGIRAGRGAIETIRLHHAPFTVHADVIGAVKPIGMCGSAYIDLLAEGRRIGLITPTGRYHAEAIGNAADKYLRVEDVHGLSLRLARGQGSRDIIVSEPDIASLLQAKAAIAAGILTLLETVGMATTSVKNVYLAGGFGMHISVPNAIAIGLLPGFVESQVQVVGNTSLAGAFLSLLDHGALREIKAVAKKIETIELNLDPGFESRYIDQLSLP